MKRNACPFGYSTDSIAVLTDSTEFKITNHKRPKIQSLIKPFEVPLDLKADVLTKRRFIETLCALTALFRSQLNSSSEGSHGLEIFEQITSVEFGFRDFPRLLYRGVEKIWNGLIWNSSCYGDSSRDTLSQSDDTGSLTWCWRTLTAVVVLSVEDIYILISVFSKNQKAQQKYKNPYLNSHKIFKKLYINTGLPMDLPVLQDLLKAIKDAVSGTRRRDDDVALLISTRLPVTWVPSHGATISRHSPRNLAGAANVKTTSELIALFTSYAKIRKRPSESTNKDSSTYPKRPRIETRSNDVKCYTCGKLGHTKAQCNRKDTTINTQPNKSETLEIKPGEFVKKFCTFCKKPGHMDSYCRFKPKTDNNTGANCSIIKDSVAKRLGCHFSPCSLHISGVGKVRFDDLCIELDIFVVKDTDCSYDLLIGRNAIQHPDIEIVTDSLGSRLYPSVLESIGSVKTGQLEIKLKKDEVVYYRPYRMAPIEREKVKELIKDLLDKQIIKEKRKGCSGPKQGLLHPIDKAAIPFHTLHLDCTGPFTTTSEGYRHTK
ncbi:hypothetical protein HW555_010282 [Spodoptera exigua]|uniref:CCHC-type domain-containing protein n=1 Tax=Spodoptera exigua TaxID=7107 RepID=A0A835L2Q8_SPOEX|nr:hypothetical protein HW555_010282 [Spodoptera exigua]